MDKDISIERAEGQVEGLNFATEIMTQLKESTKRLWITLLVVIGLWAATVAGFIWLWNQYDYTSSVEATGVFTAADNSIVTAQDVSPEQWELFMGWLNGQNKGDANTN